MARFSGPNDGHLFIIEHAAQNGPNVSYFSRVYIEYEGHTYTLHT